MSHIGSVREIERHDEGIAASAQHVDEAVFQTVAAEPRGQPELAGEAVCPQVILLAAGLEDDRLTALHDVSERREGFTRLRREEGAAARLVGVPGAHVPLGVHERLLHERDRTHRRVRVRSAQVERALEPYRLRDVRPEHPFPHTFVPEVDHRGRAPKDPFLRNRQRRAEPLRPQRRAAVFVVSQVPGG